jgi:hypothetical protein
MPDIWIFGIAALGALLAGVSKGGFGAGLGFASSAILAIVIDPATALALMLPVLMVIDLATLGPYWRKWHTPSAKVVILGSLPGMAIGAVLFSVVSADVIRVLIGLMAVAFPLFQLARARHWISPRPRPFNPRAGLAAGVGVGFTSFVSHAGGPPLAVFMLSQDGIGKTQYQATTVIVFWVVNAIKAGIYTTIGLFTLSTLTTSAAMVPFALVGTWIGVKAHGIIPERAFFLVTYVGLTATGAKLLFDGLT